MYTAKHVSDSGETPLSLTVENESVQLLQDDKTPYKSDTDRIQKEVPKYTNC